MGDSYYRSNIAEIKISKTMQPAMEETNIVEFYPTNFLSGEDMEEWGYNADDTIFKVKGMRFSRTVHRPQTGPDILMKQSARETVYGFQTNLRRDCFTKIDRLREAIEAREPATTKPMLLHYRNINPDWSWKNVAEHLAMFVAQNYDTGRISYFVVSGEEAFCRLKIIRTADEWYNGDWRHVPGAEPGKPLACCICEQSISTESQEDLIASPCQHVFHRRCIFNYIRKRGSSPNCPYCQRQIFL